MSCKHDLAEQETACVDGLCPLCLRGKIEYLRTAARALLKEIKGKELWSKTPKGKVGPSEQTNYFRCSVLMEAAEELRKVLEE